jgi:transposase
MDAQPVSLDVENLPDDLPLLKSLIRDLVTTLKDKDENIERLRHQLREALRRHYGRKSETLSEDQLALFEKLIGQELSKQPEAEKEPSAKAEVKGHGRRKPSEALPRKQEHYALPAEAQVCPDCHSPLKKIGEDAREVVEYVPASLFVRVQSSEKWACGNCQDKVVSSELPALPIERGLAGKGLLAHVVTSKYADHIPLYRLSEIFERQGFEVNRSTLCGWVAQTADLLKPVVEAMKAELLESKVLHSDDTPVPVLEDTDRGTSDGEDQADEPKGRKKARLGRLWTWVGDEGHPQTVFEYTPDRKGERPREFLKGWKGYLQADAYGGYDQLYENQAVVEVACWAHTRRKFIEAQDTDKAGARAALAYIHALYEVEKEARSLVAEQRRALRQERAGPLLETFKAWLDAQALVVLPKSAMGLALGYALRQWKALTAYVGDGDLDIDNNAAERALRCVALGRKNWLFAGSDHGGERAAVLFSLVATCKRHGMDPYAYLRDVIGRVAAHPAKDVAALMPDRWLAAKMAEKIASLVA